MRTGDRRPARTGIAARVAARIAPAAIAALVVGACGGPAPTPAPPASPVGSAETLPPPLTASPDAASPSSAPSAATVVRDDSLIALLPPDLDGTPVTVEEQSFAEAAADPAFAENVERAAFFIVASASDLASGVVAVPAPGVVGDTFLADWRETYNEGACAQAGGVATNAETTLDGRTVWITTCAGGLTVYHAYVEERGAIVSLFALGEGRYGERLVADLRP